MKSARSTTPTVISAQATQELMEHRIHSIKAPLFLKTILLHFYPKSTLSHPDKVKVLFTEAKQLMASAG